MNKYTKEEIFNMNAVDVYTMVLKGDIIKKFPNGFWQQPKAKESAAKCTRYLIEEVLNYDSEMLKENNIINIFAENKLSGMIMKCFGNSPYEAINNAYPNKYKEWEFSFVPRGFWNDKENGIKATKWLIEEKLKLNDKELKERLSKKLFIENGLTGMLNICFNNSPYDAINAAYPNKYKEWEFKNVPRSYWNEKENSIKATKWLIEEKLKLSDEELKEKLSQKLFTENGFRSMLTCCFSNSPYEAINTVYPNKFKKSDFKGYN